MSTITLIGPQDFAQVRALLLPNQPDAAAQAVLSDDMLSMPALGGRADALVKARLGSDWIGFAAQPPVIPTYYAQGDPDRAMQLLHDALAQFTCAQVVASGVMHQLVPTMTKTRQQTRAFDLKWETMRTAFTAAGYTALNLLRRAVPVPGRRFDSPAAGASGRLHSEIQPAGVGDPWGFRRDRW